ncbi:protein FAR1-RELATED SEQUENCE 5-like [Rosa rugosa]|uniref:protein FAR1-RELATED SEQUENCE 5-like n=1 Tax=Rosa rugosa TaxID=74645 RepID=UPI002B406852|nr:protein FAR1-RELATED SEQUENCE 5-like [Rosa rugosa]
MSVIYKQGDSKVQGEKRKRGLPKVGCKARIAVVRKKESGRYAISVFVKGHNHPLTSPPRAGGIQNIGFIQRDLYNYGRTCREEKKGHDGDLLYMHFQNEKEKDYSFVYTMESDEENKVTWCFWADSISRRVYSFYGDTIIFACAFLNDETADTFVWLFKEFLNAMPGDAPENASKMIITDQDPAMTKAISEALPQTFHRYCSWHILNKFSKKLDAIKYRDSYQDFHSYIWNSSSREEFDSRWIEIIEKSGLSDNKWLELIYEIRSSWIPAYVNHVFLAGMSSSQRAESQHSFFKNYVSKWNSLVEFMVQFKKGLLHQRHYELEEDHINIDEKAKTVMSLDIEDHMAKFYNFKVIRKNIDTCKSRELTYEKKFDFALCSCRKFDSEGLPCRHVLAYLIKIQYVDKLPIQYILKRWTKAARQRVVLDSNGMEIKDNKALLARLCGQSAVGLETETKTATIQHVFNETNQVRAKGCGRRLKKGKEKRKVKVKASQGRQCHGCGLFGQSHDKRNCPTLRGRPYIDEDGDSSSTSMDEDSCSSSHLAK